MISEFRIIHTLSQYGIKSSILLKSIISNDIIIIKHIVKDECICVNSNTNAACTV